MQIACTHIDIWHPEYILGKDRIPVPWAKVCRRPSDWVLEECYPEGFTWADPSKIQKAEVFRLLEHWRQREKDGLTALIWNPSCEMFDDGEICSRTIRIRKRKEVPSSPDSSASSRQDLDSPEKNSEEEDFRDDLAKIASSDSDNPESNSGSDSTFNPPSPSTPLRRSASRIVEDTNNPVEGTRSSIPDPQSHSRESLSPLINLISLICCAAGQPARQDAVTPPPSSRTHSAALNQHSKHNVIILRLERCLFTIIGLHFSTITGTICPSSGARPEAAFVPTQSWRR